MKHTFLDLGAQPIANNFLSNLDEEEYKFNLTVEFDDETKLVSLGEFVRPELMFNDSYVYYSSNSKTMQSHFRDYANVLKEEFSPEKVMEIGSNDGVFIKNFSSDTTVAIEPCGNFAKITNSIGYRTYDKFWNLEVAEQIIQNHDKRDLISSSNCVCHMQNLDEAFSAINRCLTDDGIFVFEDPSLLKMLERVSYDQIYDEHAHIFSVTSLQNLLNRNGLEIFRVENLVVHGGSNRIYACKLGAREIENSVTENLSLEQEYGIQELATYKKFAKKVATSKDALLELLTDMKNEGRKVVSYGATSKSTTVFNYCGIGPDLIDYIVDTTEAKQGKLSPGMHIPVVPPQSGFNDTVDVAFLGAWNYEKEILSKEENFLKGGGRFVTHIPYVRFM
jgi:SAM-dependent methyltransferase